MKIVIADDHALFRDSLRSLLEAHGLEVVGEARNGREAVELARRLTPDVVLMDLGMPEMDGLAATRLICAEQPQVKVVILTASDEDAKLFEAIKSGAQGYLLKNLEAKEFFSILERVQEGEPALTPAVARRLLQEFAAGGGGSAAAARTTGPAGRAAVDPDALTDREQAVLELLVQGTTSNRKLAHELGVSENTVKFHVRNILDKLHLHNRAQVVGYAVRHRLVDSGAGPG
jgi:DNA-binding NarL/FixJ family response regulator